MNSLISQTFQLVAEAKNVYTEPCLRWGVPWKWLVTILSFVMTSTYFQLKHKKITPSYTHMARHTIIIFFSLAGEHKQNKNIEKGNAMIIGRIYYQNEAY